MTVQERKTHTHTPAAALKSSVFLDCPRQRLKPLKLVVAQKSSSQEVMASPKLEWVAECETSGLGEETDERIGSKIKVSEQAIHQCTGLLLTKVPVGDTELPIDLDDEPDKTSSHAEFAGISPSDGSLLASQVGRMWIFHDANTSFIDVRDWGMLGRGFMKNGVQKYLRWAMVAPKNRLDETCSECKQPAHSHDENCKYHGQQKCGWCNMYPCWHADENKCVKKHFGCNFCHWHVTGHCVGNPKDVLTYRLNDHGMP